MDLSPTVIFIVVAYLCAMLTLGFWSGRQRISSADDFLVAGRRLHWALLAATLAATEVGGGSSLGVVQKAYGQWGLGAAWYVWSMVGSFSLIALIAPVLARTRCRTIPQYFAQRYSKTACLLTATLMLTALAGLAAVQMIATGLVLSVMTGMNYVTATLSAGVVVVVYTYCGGMWSVSLTDFAQWIFIVLGLGAAIPFALQAAGGANQVLHTVPASSTDILHKIGLGEVVSLIALSIASQISGQESMQRLYSARDVSHARRGACAAAGFYLGFGILPAALGLIALSLVRQGILPLGQLQQLGDNALLPLLAAHTLPPVLTGVLFSGLISATMSSADSNLLGAASIWSNDIAPILLNSEEEGLIGRTRRAVLAIGAGATAIAIVNSSDLIAMLKIAFGLRSAGPFFPFILGHFWKATNNVGAIAAIVGGTATMLALLLSEARPWGADPTLFALAAAGLLCCAGTLLAPRTDASPP